ncbi:MAG: hypothetical protein R2751_02785 [Bacteroidales bacterium]
MSSTHLLDKCLKGIEQRLDWVDSGLWQQKHFESLSALIFEKTKVSLSPLTLKRLWGKTTYESKPSATTLDTLAQFLDYKDWIDFQSRQKRKGPFVRMDSKLVRRSIAFGVLLLCLVGLVGVSMKVISRTKRKDFSDVSFSVQKLSSGLPNTVYFKYNVKNTNADSVVIEQSWDPRFHHLVDKAKTDFSCIYFYPGYYKAKLVLDDVVVSQQDLYIASNGWLGIIEKESIPEYLPGKEIFDGSVLAINENQLVEAGFDLKNVIPQTSIHLVEEFDGLEGTDFELEASFRHTLPEGEAICQNAALMITCAEDYFYLPFSMKGCVNELSMHLPGKTLHATDTDLRTLGIGPSETIHLSLKVSQGILDLVVNSNPGIRESFVENPGKIVGIKFVFHGPGEVDAFRVNNAFTAYSMQDFLP